MRKENSPKFRRERINRKIKLVRLEFTSKNLINVILKCFWCLIGSKNCSWNCNFIQAADLKKLLWEPWLWHHPDNPFVSNPTVYDHLDTEGSFCEFVFKSPRKLLTKLHTYQMIFLCQKLPINPIISIFEQFNQLQLIFLTDINDYTCMWTKYVLQENRPEQLSYYIFLDINCLDRRFWWYRNISLWNYLHIDSSNSSRTS